MMAATIKMKPLVQDTNKQRDAGEDLLKQLEQLRRANPTTVDSYREFLEAYAKFKRAEWRINCATSSGPHVQHDTQLPA